MRSIHYLFNLLVQGMALVPLCGIAALAQMPTYNRGRAPSAEEIRAWDISVDPAGKGLPPGSGTAKTGAQIFAQKCGPCHGPTGVGPANPAAGYIGRPGLIPLVGNKGTLQMANLNASLLGDQPAQGIQNYASAPTLWENIKRSMPPVGSLSADEAYAVTAYLLYRNGIIQESDVMDAKSLPKVEMPKQNELEPRMRRYMAAPVP